MYKVINGKRYDTDTAQKMGTQGYDYGGLYDVEETLYRKKTGEFFIYGCGGAGSKYAKPAAGGGTIGGEEIIPATEEYAREWVEEYLDGEDYDRIFGEPEETEELRRASISMPPELYDKLAARAETDGVTVSAVVKSALAEYLK